MNEPYGKVNELGTIKSLNIAKANNDHSLHYVASRSTNNYLIATRAYARHTGRTFAYGTHKVHIARMSTKLSTCWAASLYFVHTHNSFSGMQTQFKEQNHKKTKLNNQKQQEGSHDSNATQEIRTKNQSFHV